MGVVFRAHDTERATEVALKLLQHADPSRLLRFKTEFRSLADVSHPNLVSLYELLQSGDDWLLSMELVDGIDFNEYVRGSLARANDETQDMPARRDAPTPASTDPNATVQLAVERGPSQPPLSDPAQLDRLRRGLRQLAAGVQALHEAGILHRDLKPSNVLVSRHDGRVVILDFGVVAALAPDSGDARTLHIVGTPSYMAPEQAAGETMTVATDWYAVGVMLYQALAGRPPFAGAPHAVIQAKQVTDAPSLADLAPAAPRDLIELGEALLRREPSARPTGPEVLARLAAPASPSSRPRTEAAEVFVGRQQELAALRDALAAVEAGEARTVLVRGRSGVGKSMLTHRFLREVADDRVVLRGRCYERESVPYKAVDGVIDQLAAYLGSRPRGELEPLLPANIAHLARLFPVLRRVELIHERGLFQPAIADAYELRGRAFAALRELLARLAERRPVVLYIDDLQWGDVDSAALLTELVRPPEPPRVLLIGTSRAEGDAGPLLRALLDAGLPGLVALELGPLSSDAARELAQRLLPADGGGSRERADAIARESEGNPFFVHELAAYLGGAAASPAQARVSLDEVVLDRVAALDDDARVLLRTVAVAGRPIPQAVAKRAARIDGDDRPVLARLRGARLVRTSGARGEDVVEHYHDRIREAVTAALSSAELRERHAALAHAMELHGSVDPEMLAVHQEGAGEAVRAAAHYRQAADEAAGALAFGRAARLYARAVELSEARGQDGVALLEQYGDALSKAGRCVEAAAELLRAAEHAKAGHAVDLRRRAAEQLLHGGQVEDGVATFEAVLAAVDVRFPRSPRGAIASLLWLRVLLRLRGVGFRERDDSQIPSETLAQMDACWSASVGYGMVDPIRGAYFQMRHMMKSLAAGEPSHVARALAVEGCYRSLDGPAAAHKAVAIVERSRALADRLGNSVAIGWAWAAAALARYQTGEWRAARDQCADSVEVLRAQSTGLAWERACVELYHLWTLFYTGELAELRTRTDGLLRDARGRGDRYSVTNLTTGLPGFSWLVADRPDDARELADQAMSWWPSHSFHLQHYWHLLCMARLDLYVGEPRRAVERIDGRWSALRRSLILRLSIVSVELRPLLAHALIAAAADASAGERAALVRRARRLLRAVARTRYGWTPAVVTSLRAALDVLHGDDDAAARRYRDAIEGFEQCGMKLHAEATRFRLGELIGGDEGRAASRTALAYFQGQGVARPDALIATVAADPRRRRALP